MKLYIAYGSNLCKQSMRRRCPEARPVGKILLKNARLVFRGVADLEYSETESTPCGVWWVSPQDEAALDRYEGIRTGFYYRDMSTSLRYRGESKRALLYLMGEQHSTGIYPPCQDYFDTLRRGYRDFGLDESYLIDALNRSFADKRPDDQTRERRMRQRRSSRTSQLVGQPGDET